MKIFILYQSWKIEIMSWVSLCDGGWGREGLRFSTFRIAVRPQVCAKYFVTFAMVNRG